MGRAMPYRSGDVSGRPSQLHRNLRRRRGCIGSRSDLGELACRRHRWPSRRWDKAEKMRRRAGLPERRALIELGRKDHKQD